MFEPLEPPEPFEPLISGLGPDRFVQAREDVAVERRVLAPGGRRHQAAVSHRLGGHVLAANRLDFKTHVLVASELLAFGESCSRDELDPVADGEDPLLLGVELAENREPRAHRRT
jgi:hypothetical protein